MGSDLTKAYSKDLVYPLVLLWPHGVEMHLEILAHAARVNPDFPRLADSFDKINEIWKDCTGRLLEDTDGFQDFSKVKRVKDAFFKISKDSEVRSHIAPRIKDVWGQWDWLGRFALTADIEDAIFGDDFGQGGGGQGGGALKNEVRLSLSRFLSARDSDPSHGVEIPDSMNHYPGDASGERFIHHRIARFLDHITEEMEEICRGVGYKPFDKLQESVDTAQRFFHQGLAIVDKLNDADSEIVRPYLANVEAFLEAFDQALHSFVEHPRRSCSIALAMTVLHESLGRKYQPGDALLSITDLAPVRMALARGGGDCSLWSGDGRGLLKRLLELREMNIPGKGGNEEKNGDDNRALNPFRGCHSWMVLGPRVLRNLALSAAERAIERRGFSFSENLLKAFHLPKRQDQTSESAMGELKKSFIRFFSGWTSWIVPGVIYFPWVLISFLEAYTSVQQPDLIVNRAIGYTPLVLLALLVGSLMFQAIHKPTAGAMFSFEMPASEWRGISDRVHLNLLLFPFIFRAGVGVFIAATIEFDYQLWLTHFADHWWKLASLLFGLCFLGCYQQIRSGSMKARLTAALQTLGVFTALAHVPAVVAAIFLHSAYENLKETMKHSIRRGEITVPLGQRMQDLPGPDLDIFGFKIFLYHVMFLALAGLVVGILGDSFRGRKIRGG